MKILSRPTNYGLQAALYLASQEGERRYTPVKEISTRLGLPYPFLAKIVQTLVREGLMVSNKGPNGGVSLARSADEITLAGLVSAMEGDDFFETCILELPGCGKRPPCPLHNSWVSIRENLKALFEKTTLAELAARLKEEDIRIGLG